VTSLDRHAAWPAPVLWALLAILAAGPVGDAIDGRSTAVRWLVVIGLWAAWTLAAVCLLVPRHGFLTGLRILVPAGLAAVLAAVLAGPGPDAVAVAAVAVAALATAWVLAPWVGERWVDGSSYGAERRLPLRPPTLFSLLLVPLTWAVVVAGATAGPLLLAAGRWLPGTALTAVGLPAAAIGTRSLHQLARRWVVLVPTGLVLHDPLLMPEPQLFPRPSIRRLGPATEDDPADDLTGAAAGLALRLSLHEPVDLLLRRRGRRTETVASTALLFTPSRPGRVLEAAAGHRIPVG